MSDEVESFLEHHGVKGMKWGKRSNGGAAPSKTRTIGGPNLSKALGKHIVNKVKAKTAAHPVSQDHATTKALRKKQVRSLSNAELKQINERLQLQKSYSELANKTSTITRGDKKAKEILGLATTAASLYALSKTPAGKAGIDLGKKLIAGN